MLITSTYKKTNFKKTRNLIGQISLGSTREQPVDNFRSHRSIWLLANCLYRLKSLRDTVVI